jgi:branched-chain amino acid transport system substrate-binding protein
MKNGKKFFSLFLMTLFLSVVVSGNLMAAKNTFKLGIVTFLSGAAAGPFGVPSKKAAELTIKQLNEGKIPSPYNKIGIAGKKIEVVWVDEAGSATKQVEEYRNLVQQKKVDAVIGYISSGHCMAIAPIAEELGTLTVLYDCGTPRIFEDNSYHYVFRTGLTATIDNVGAARYIVDLKKNLKSVSAINQNYAWGQDSWHDFISSLKDLKPDIQVKTVQFPKIFQGQYGSEISSLMVNPADFIHSSFWGGDLEALILQGGARGLFENQIPIFTCGEASMFRLAKQLPKGAIVGARGPFGLYAPNNKLNKWFRNNYISKYGISPTYPAYKMVQAIFGLKAAAEKAATKNKNFSQEDIIKSFEYLKFQAPSGTVKMNLGKGHQAMQGIAYGQYVYKNGKPSFENVKWYPAECVNPPDGVKSIDWIKSGMKGAKCN